MRMVCCAKLVVFFVAFVSFLVALFSVTSTSSTNISNEIGLAMTLPVSVNNRSLGYNCTVIVEKLKQLQHPWEINELRRAVAMEHATCLENNEVFSLFAQAAQRRIGIKQYNLHIPKTGGTSLCGLAKANGLKSPGNNCHPNMLGAYWCCLPKTVLKPMSCEQLQQSPFGFIGNERWLDHNNNSLFCKDMAYSITVREPIARTMSQMNMYLDKFVARDKNNAHAAIRAKRISLIQSNYMTWSLVSGLLSEDPTAFLVEPQHLALAKQILNRFDYVMDIGGATSPECLETILEYMGMTNNTLSHSRKSPFREYTASYHEEHYQMLNAVDTELYRYAQEVIRVDCDFFQRIKELKLVQE